MVRMKEHRALIRAWFGGVAEGVLLELLPDEVEKPTADEDRAAPASLRLF